MAGSGAGGRTAAEGADASASGRVSNRRPPDQTCRSFNAPARAPARPSRKVCPSRSGLGTPNSRPSDRNST
ncbi:hypothetical protein, partial [Paenibacillus sp. GbtcB18]|uniref:hypothetical protein n=1 Tax=Paenibacillus sp. GbtcB18 TaxID=2824763 RepID=UPI001C30BE18